MTTLENLPPEIIQKICQHLSIVQVIALSNVSHGMSSIINHKSFWHRRFMIKSSSDHHCIPEKNVNWKAACISLEQIRSWFEPGSDTCVHCTKQHYTSHCIDAIRILKHPSSDFFAVGDRGGTFSIFSLRDFIVKDDPNPFFTDSRTHAGWIWTISSDYDVIATGSWDKYLRLWGMTDQRVDCISQYKMNSAVLSSDFLDPNLVVAGTYKSVLGVFDFRAPLQTPILSNEFHTGTVLCVKSPYSLSKGTGGLSSTYASSTTINFSDTESSSLADHSLNDNSGVEIRNAAGDSAALSQNVAFYSGCKDGRLAAWDLRQFNQPLAEIKLNGYPRDISLVDNEEMWVATHPNKLQVFRTSSTPLINDGFLSCAATYTLSKSVGGGICALEATQGGVFLARAPGSVDVLYPTDPLRSMLPQPIHHERNDPPVSLSFANDTLLIGAGNGNISLWMSAEQSRRLTSNDPPP